MSKRRSLAVTPAPVAAEPASTPVATPAPPAPVTADHAPKAKAAIGSKGRISMSVYLSLEAYDQLKDLARAKRMKAAELFRDGLNKMFEDNGMPPIA